MSFSEIIGQKRVVSILSKIIKNQRIPHALLFHGPVGVGKTAVAMALAKAVLCQDADLYCDVCSDCKRVAQLTHPDLVVLFPTPAEPKIEDVKKIRESIVKNPYIRTELWAKPSISIKAIRELKKMVSMTSYENKGRVIILIDAHRMTEEASNSVLKILEEPPKNVNLILITNKPNLLLSTIVSRCQQLKFDPLTPEEVESALIEREQIEPERANIVARMSFGSYQRALELLDENISEKQEIMIEVLRKIIRNDLDILLMVEQLASRLDLKMIKDVLIMMDVWFRDAMRYDRLNGDQKVTEKIINVDRLDTLKNFINSFEPLDYELIHQKIEFAIQLIDRNVYVNAILLQLIYELKQLLRRKKHV